MEAQSCDVAIIGAGTAGLAAHSSAVAAGARVLLIERGPGGTTCARVGCMPSKLLLAAASAAHAARTAHRFGVKVPGGVVIDGAAVMARVRHERDRFVDGVLSEVAKIPDDQKLSGIARFETPGRLIVGERICVDARSIVIATGSSSVVPLLLAPVRSRVLTNETLFDLDHLPESMAVLGAGPLGLELAQALTWLGLRVALFDTSAAVGGLRDPAMREAAAGIFGAALDLRLECEVSSAQAEDGGVRLGWRDSQGNAKHEAFDYVLAAAGRAPNLHELALDRAGLSLDQNGVPQFDPQTLRCGDSSIFVAGDVDGTSPVLHEAAAEGRIAGANAARFPQVQAHPRMTPLAIVFSEPNIAAVGASLQQAGDEAVTGTASYADQGRAKIAMHNAGLIRLYADAQGRLLGGELLGPGIEHLAHLLAWCVQQGLTASQMLRLPFYHPTIEEGLRTGLREICGKLGSLQADQRDAITEGPIA